MVGLHSGKAAPERCCTQVHGSSSAYRFCFMADKPRHGQGAAPCCSSEGRTAAEPPGDQPAAGIDSIRPQRCYCRAQHEQAVRGALNREEYSPVTSRGACSNLLLRVVGTIGYFSCIEEKTAQLCRSGAAARICFQGPLPASMHAACILGLEPGEICKHNDYHKDISNVAPFGA